MESFDSPFVFFVRHFGYGLIFAFAWHAFAFYIAMHRNIVRRDLDR